MPVKNMTGELKVARNNFEDRAKLCDEYIEKLEAENAVLQNQITQFINWMVDHDPGEK